MSSSTVRHFHEELSHLKQRLMALSSEAEDAIGNAVEALLRRDKVLALEVIRGDRTINTLESAIEEQAFQLIALHQPMAKDLRQIFSAIKTAHDLERVGDHAVNIAQSAERLLAYANIVPEPELVEMARLSRAMLADALGAFVRGDAPLAREVCRRDDAVDSLNDSVFRILLTHMMEDQRSIGACLELLLVSRNLERVADLATNIAEDVVFVAEGKTIKHHAEDGVSEPRTAPEQPLAKDP
jgi:phosphate transport system protein